MTLYSLHDFRLTPSITVSESDNRQLTVLALAGSGHTTDAADDLLHELERARVVDDRDLPPDIVCMGSLVTFRTDDGRETMARLVFPEEADIAARKISVMTPVGTALIGLRSGQSIGTLVSVVTQIEDLPADPADRAFWDRDLIAEGIALAGLAFARPPLAIYTIQAMIAATHASAREATDTDWSRIVGYYDLLLRADPSPIVALNRAVAIAMRDGPAAGLALIDPLAAGDLANYRFAHAARADLLRRLGHKDEARAAYDRALELTGQGQERTFLLGRIEELR
jgi:transcription elongation GreA/GreB family factor